jgi:hypothetical protein
VNVNPKPGSKDTWNLISWVNFGEFFYANFESFEEDSRPARFSRWLEVFPVGQFRKNAAHRLFRQAGVSVYNFSDGHACGERLENKCHGNPRAAHTRATSKMLRVSDNPVIHAISLR